MPTFLLATIGQVLSPKVRQVEWGITHSVEPTPDRVRKMTRQGSAKSATSGSKALLFALLIAVMLAAPSCRHTGDPIHYLGREYQADYIGEATSINFPDDVSTPSSEKLDFAVEPRRLRNEQKDEVWDLHLSQAIEMALSQSTVIRSSGQFLSPGNPILQNPDFASSVFDPALQESGVLFGNRGAEAALSEFDTQFTTRMLWGRDEQIQNNFISNGLGAGETLIDETASFNSSLRKRLSTGGQIELSHSVNYTGRNIPTIGSGGSQLFSSAYAGNVQMQFRQPLLAGGGAEYTRIAGPVSSNIQGVTGVQQGVIIARINNDMELADFDKSVQQLVHDVELLYWQLHTAYQTYATLTEAKERAYSAWDRIESQRLAETGEGASIELDLRDNYFDLKGRATLARDNIYSVEARLRLLIGLSVNDGTVIRPADSPITADFIPDWGTSLADALVNRPEIRRQKWSIKSTDLQLRAAENLLMPRLDFVSGYSINGFGDDLFGRERDGNQSATGNLGSFYRTLRRNEQTGWNLGFEVSMPLGRRFAHTQVQSLELQLAKAQAMLREQENEISHEVASVFRDIDRTYLGMENAYNRLRVSKEAHEIAKAKYESDPERYTISFVMQAASGETQAEMTLFDAVQRYNIALADLHYRTGKTLSANNISLSEGTWDRPAYDDARENFEHRQHARPGREWFLRTAPDLSEQTYLNGECVDSITGETCLD